MAAGQRVMDEAPAEHLCAAAAIEDGGRAWVFDVLEYGRPMRAFVLRFDGRVHAYLNRCAHVPTEMDWQSGEFFDADKRFILCSIHGAAYEPSNGRCISGPCGRGKLTPLRVQERSGEVYWYPSRDVQPVTFDSPAPAGDVVSPAPESSP